MRWCLIICCGIGLIVGLLIVRVSFGWVIVLILGLVWKCMLGLVFRCIWVNIRVLWVMLGLLLVFLRVLVFVLFF